MKKYIVRFLVVPVLILTAHYAFAVEVVELQKPSENTIVIKMMFKNGSVADPEGKEGLTALTATLMKEGGTSEWTKAEINGMIYPMAARYDVSVDKEVSVFTFQVHKDFLTKFYPVIKGLMLDPSLTEEDFNRVKSNQQRFVDKIIRSSSDEEYSKKALEDFLFRGTPYQHMVKGTSAGVAAITLDDVKHHYRQFFTRHNLMIGIAGDYSADFVSRLKADMKNLPDIVPELPPVVTPEMPKGIHVEIISKENALGSAIFTGSPIDINRSQDEFAALMIANSWLGEHRKSYSRLYQKIRQDRAMNYGDYSYIEWYEKGGQNQLPLAGVPRSSNYFAVWIRPVQIADQLKVQYPELKDITVGHAHFALRMAVKEINQLIENGLSEKDFNLTKEFLRSYIKLYIQTTEKELGFLMDSKFYGRDDYIRELDGLLEKTTLEEVNNAIRKHFQTQNMYITIITDDSEARKLAESLRKNKLSPMSYSNTMKEGLSAEILKEDNEVAAYPLNIKSVKVIKDGDTFQKLTEQNTD